MDQLRALEEWELRWGVRNPSQTQWRAQAALAQMALGAHDEACRLADEDLLRASAFGAPRRSASRCASRGSSRAMPDWSG